MIINFPNAPNIAHKSRDRLSEMGVVFNGRVENTTEDIDEKLADSEILICNYIALDEVRLKKLKHLKYIITPSVGTDWIDIKAAKSLGITVSNCPTFCIDTVAEHAITLTLGILRQIKILIQSGGDLASLQLDQSFELSGKTVGLVGYGNIGKRIESLLSGFNVTIQKINSSSKETEVQHILETSDVIIMTLPLTDTTKNFMSKEKIALLQPHAVLINVGRQQTIDEQALYTAITNSQLAGAGLDVTDQTAPKLLQLPRVIYTAHTAYASAESFARKGDELIEVLNSCRNHQPINIIDSIG